MRLFDWLTYVWCGVTLKDIEDSGRPIILENLDPMVEDNGREKIWCETYSGMRVYPTYFQECGVNIEDIAHALSNQCRYNGHTKKFYSVAEHCVHMCDYAMDEGRTAAEGLHALLHDACEAYIGDIPRPIKCAVPKLKEVETEIDRVIGKVFGLPAKKPDWLDELDARIVVDERAQAMSRSGHKWVHDVLEPLGVIIGFWKPQDAKLLFLRRYRVLTDLIKDGDCNE